VATHVFPHIKIRRKEEFLTWVCRYWSLKREARRGAGLLKRLHLEPWTAAVTAKEHTEAEKALKLKLMAILKVDMDKVVSLIDLVAKREQLKLDHSVLIKEVMLGALYPIGQVMKDMLARLKEFDCFLHARSDSFLQQT
jgi:NuA3 HAT complex component NTO1